MLWRFMGFLRPPFSVEVELCWLMGALCPPTSFEVKLWQFMGEILPPMSVLNPILFNDGNFENIILLFTHPKKQEETRPNFEAGRSRKKLDRNFKHPKELEETRPNFESMKKQEETRPQFQTPEEAGRN